MIFSVLSSYTITWYATIDYHKHYMRLKRGKKLIPLITFFLFLAFIIEPWGQSPPGYVALKSLKKILGGDKKRLLVFFMFQRKERIQTMCTYRVINSEYPNVLHSNLISWKRSSNVYFCLHGIYLRTHGSWQERWFFPAYQSLASRRTEKAQRWCPHEEAGLCPGTFGSSQHYLNVYCVRAPILGLRGEADVLKKQDNLRSFWVARKEMTFSEKHKICSEYEQYKVLNCLNTCRWRGWFLLDWSGRSQKASQWSWYPAWPWNAEDFEWTRSWGRGLHERNTTAKA